MIKSIIKWFGSLLITVLACSMPAYAVDVLATELNATTTFTASDAVQYDLKVTLKSDQKIEVKGASSGPGNAQVAAVKAEFSGPEDVKIGFVTHQAGDAVYLVFGILKPVGSGGSGGGDVPEWENTYVAGNLDFTLVLTDKIGGKSMSDDTSPDEGTSILYCMSSDGGKGSVGFGLVITTSHDGTYGWVIKQNTSTVANGTLNSGNGWKASRGNLHPGIYQLEVTKSGDATFKRRIDFVVFFLAINGEMIDQDDPTNTTWAALAPVVHGGSEPSTADNVRLHVTVVPQEAVVSSYSWSVTGPGQAGFTPPTISPTAYAWDIGDIPVLPGEYEFTCTVTFEGGVAGDVSTNVEVGVRTDDYIVVGWINRNGVPMPAGGSTYITGVLPPGGPPVPNSLEANLLMLDLSENDTSPNFHPLTAGDRTYIINWLFRYSDNPDPTTIIPLGNFRNAEDTHINYTKVDWYRQQQVTNYKLFNHFQIRYRVDFTNGGFNGSPTVLHAKTGIGTTPNPLGSVAGFLGQFPGQSGPANGPPAVLPPPGNHRMSLINDGSPDSGGIRAFNTLTGRGVANPVFWENIISQIRFVWDEGASANVIVQPYPTYYIFRNGRHVHTIAQAATPLGNFHARPYPFGTVNCVGALGVTPGGRCGDATSPADITARIVPSMIP